VQSLWGRVYSPAVTMAVGAPPAGSEELDGVAGRILGEDLLAADARHDVVAQAHSRLAQRSDRGFHVFDLDREAVPAAGSCCRPSGIGCPPPAEGFGATVGLA
jgi:hypothetical protein